MKAARRLLLLFILQVLTARWTNAGASDANLPPLVKITSPQRGDILIAPASLPVRADAVDSDGTVSKVEFYAGSTKIGESATPPFEIAWGGVTAGLYWLTAIATDNQGAIGVSTPVEIAVISGACGSAPGILPNKSPLPDPVSNTLEVYFGQDVSAYPPFVQNQVPRPADIPFSRRSAAAFQARLPGVLAENFEEFAWATEPTQVQFGTNVVSLSGDQIINEVVDPNGTINGEFPTSGTHGLELMGSSGSGFFGLDFASPQAAFGFYATDIELNGLNVTLLRPDGSTQALRVPVKTPQGSGGAIFYGIIDATHPFVKVQLSRDGSLEDSFLFDDLLVATPAQLIPEVDWPRVGIGDPSPVTVPIGQAGRVVFSVALSASITKPVDVPYVTIDGSARSGSDYVSTNGVIHFAPGDTRADIPVEVLPQLHGPTNAFFSVQLSNPTNAILGQCEATGIIHRTFNTPPTISAIPDQKTFQNASTPPIPFTIGDLETPSETLVVVAESSNPELIPSDGLTLGGSSSSRTITLKPALNQLGAATITLTVKDGDGATALTSFLLNVVPSVNLPPGVRVAKPIDRTILDLGEPIEIRAEAFDPDGSVSSVDFYVGDNKVGSSAAAPFTFIWNGAAEGDYVLTAKAVDQKGAVTSSAPVRIAVSDVCGSAAIIQSSSDPEMNKLEDYLYELGVRSAVFSREDLVVSNLTSFDLVVWDDVGNQGIAAADVILLQNLVLAGKALYLIGDDLTSSMAGLPADARAQWAALLGVQVAEGSSSTSQVHLLGNAVGSIGAGTVLEDGKVGTIDDFTYSFGTNAIAKAIESDAVTVLGRAGGADVLVASDDTSSGGSGRRLTQLFRITNGTDQPSLTERKRLFQNAVWWLLNCKLCSNLNLHPEGTSSPDGVIAGDLLTYNITVDVAGGCEALGVTISSVLPPSAQFESAQSQRGQWNYSSGVVTFNLGRLTRDSGIPETVTINVRPTSSGLLTNSCTLRSLNETAGALTDNQFEIVSQVAPGLHLDISRGVGTGVLVNVEGPAGRSCRMEASDDDGPWSWLKDLSLLNGTNRFVDSLSGATKQRIYRGVLK